MISVLLPTPTTTRKVKASSQMATDSSQRLTFYEDLYLKPYKKSSSLPTRHYRNTYTEHSKRQSTAIRNENGNRSSSQSPVNNPLLDSPPSSRLLTLANTSSRDNSSRVVRGDTNNNNPTSQRRIEARNSANALFVTNDANETYNHLITSPPLRRAQTLPDDHVYEIIPAQKHEFPQAPHKKHYDESNYLISSTSDYTVVDACRLRRNRETRLTSNLRSMRRIGRSVDSLSRGVNGNKLRSQSTILAPQLWMRSASNGPLATALSCDNLTDNILEFGRLSHGLTILDKENTSPDLKKGEVDLRTVSSRTEHPSPRHKRSEDNVSQKSSNSSLHNIATRMSHTNHRRYHHSHSSSYAGSSNSTYENMDQIYKNLNQGCSNYVNIQEFRAPEKELNYADLDFTPIKHIEKNRVANTRLCRSVTPTKHTRMSSVDNGNDDVEYTTINITATEAARRACAEHQRYRQRRNNSNLST